MEKKLLMNVCGHVFSKAYDDIPGGLSGTFENGVDFQGGIDWVVKSSWA